MRRHFLKRRSMSVCAASPVATRDAVGLCRLGGIFVTKSGLGWRSSAWGDKPPHDGEELGCMYAMFFFTQYSHRERDPARETQSVQRHYRTHSRTPHILNNIELN